MLQWDTKKIVCDKAYLKNRGRLPAAHRRHCERIERPLDARKP